MSSTEPANLQQPKTKKEKQRWGTRAELAALASCALFSLLLIANVHTANEGGWFLYARFVMEGHRLYSGMHLPLQPLYVEETIAFLTILGKSWLTLRIQGLIQALAFCIGLYLIVRKYTTLAGWEKALLLVSGYFTSIAFVGYRFDDYHILSDCINVFSILAVLRIEQTTTDGKVRFASAVAAGVLAGLSITTRLNDGAALLLAVLTAVFILVPYRRWFSTAVACASAAVTVVMIVLLTGDSLRDWATTSIFQAAAAKGGTGTVLAHPLELSVSAIETLEVWQNLQFVLYLFACASIFGLVILPALGRRGKARIWPSVFGTIAILAPLHRYWYRGNFEDQKLMIDLSAVGVFLIFGLGIAAFPIAAFKVWRARALRSRSAREILMLIPLGQLASGAMSSGGSHIGIYGPLATTILLLPLIYPRAFALTSLRGFTVAMATVLALHCAVFKSNVPYLWHTYRSPRMFVDRQWYKHPDYGAMIIDENLLHMIQPLCSIVHSEPDKELLSLPYPYPNYFCSIEPWHGYVQTFFDTSNSATIFHLMDELNASPPKWIVYQRQLQVLSLHEQVYNHGQPLPHRYLDQLIENKLATGQWHARYRSTFGTRPGLSDEWILIRTH